MAKTVPMDAAALRAAVADERYWQAGHPEQAAWRSWVTQGFQAVYREGRSNSGVVHVRAYMRDGHMVSAHTRSAPPRNEFAEDAGGRLPGATVSREPQSAEVARVYEFGMRRSVLEPSNITPVARRPDRPRGVHGGEIPTPMDGPWGGAAGPRQGAPAAPSQSAPARSATPPSVSPRSQELVDMVSPGGVPIGRRVGDAQPHTRTLSGGEEGARAFFRRLIEGRSLRDVTRPGHPGQMMRLDDGSIISFRPASRSDSGLAAVDIKIPGFLGVRKIHFD